MSGRTPALVRQARTLATQAQSSSSSSTASASAFGSLPPLSQPTATPLPSNTAEAISLLRSSSTPSTGRYLLARLHSRTYLLHPRDILTVPRLKPAPEVGSKMALTRILEVGSREFALRSPAANAKELRKHLPKGPVDLPTIPEGLVKCELTVLEHTKSPMTSIMLKKRRKGYERTIKSKMEWTRLRVGDIELAE